MGYMEIWGVVDAFLVWIAVMVSWVYAYITLIKCRVYRMFIKAVFLKDMYMRSYISKGIPPTEASLEEVIEAVTGTGWPF